MKKTLFTLAILAASAQADYMCNYYTNLAQSTKQMFLSKAEACNKFGCNEFERELVYSMGKSHYEAVIGMVEACNIKNVDDKIKALEETIKSWRQ